jgi:adenylate kinase family enzyme
MKRVLVIGSSGSGKSHFSRRLSGLTGIEVIHLDRYYWKPNWVESEKDEFDGWLAGILERDSWIIDGNYGRTLEWRLSMADTAIMLDLSHVICTFRVLKRLLFLRNGKRIDMAEGCGERFDWEFLKWTWHYPTTTRERVLARLKAAERELKIFHLTSRKEVRNFFDALRKGGDLEGVDIGLWK